jgi:hypothetical protein
VREHWQTAGPSTSLRSGRDDKVSVPLLGNSSCLVGLAGLHFALAPDENPVLLRDTGSQEIYSVQLGRR